MEKVGNKAIAELQRISVCADNVGPNVIADMNLPLIGSGAGLGNRRQLRFFTFLQLNRFCRRAVAAVDLETASGGKRRGQRHRHQTEHHHAAEEQRQ